MRRAMLSLSKTTGYAVQALSCLETEACHSHCISDVAKCSRVPRSYLPKIINSLSRNGLVTTKRGYRGGISLARDPADISVLEIVEAVEGKAWLGECLLGMDDCEIRVNCVTHTFWTRIRREITKELRNISLASLIRFKDGQTARKSARPSNRKKVAACCPIDSKRIPE
jgi:Rrf2 family protein